MSVIRKISMFFVVLISLAIFAYAFYYFDPLFNKTVYYDEVKIEYEWQLFDNGRCQARTGGHCVSNYFRLYGAELTAAKAIMAAGLDKAEEEKKLISIISHSKIMSERYERFTNSNEIRIDSIMKHKEEIFRPLYIE